MTEAEREQEFFKRFAIVCVTSIICNTSFYQSTPYRDAAMETKWPPRHTNLIFQNHPEVAPNDLVAHILVPADSVIL